MSRKLLTLSLLFLCIGTSCNSRLLRDLTLSSKDGGCPVEDETFCAFVQEIEADLTSSNMNDFIGKVVLYDCKQSGGGPYGPVPEDFCGSDQWCLKEIVLQGEGGCFPLSQALSWWEQTLSPPISVRGLVFTIFPDLGMKESRLLDTPAIVLETYDPEWDVILLTNKDNGAWVITELALQRKTMAEYQTPMGIVVPWQWPSIHENFYWLGMKIPFEAWLVGASSGDPTSYGILINQTLPGCKVHAVDDVEDYLREEFPGLEFSSESSETTELIITLYTTQDETVQPMLAYYDITDKTGSRGYDLFRLFYFLVEAEEDIDGCSGAFYTLLLTMQPKRFPDLPVPQG